MNKPVSCKPQKQHIVIVGGGMVGISLALLLSKSLLKDKESTHFTITLIEQFSLSVEPKSMLEQVSFDARSTVLSAGSAKIFDEMGCWQALKNLAEPIKTIHVSDKGRLSNVNINAEESGVDAVGHVVENQHLGSILLSKLQQTAVNCLAPAKVISCVPKRKGYSLTVEHVSKVNDNSRETLHADLLVVADGAESALRKKLGVDAQYTDYNQSALITNVALAQTHNNIAYERFTDTGPIALLPLPASKLQENSLESSHRAALVWIIPRDEQEDYLNISNEKLLARLQERFGYRAGQFVAVGERQAYPLTLIQACEQVRSNLIIIGNAAHFLHPVAGQGFNLALRDCYQLMGCLTQAGLENKSLGELSVLNQYLDKQSFDQGSTIAVTDSLIKLFSSAQLSKAILRQLGLFGLNTSFNAKQIFAKKMMGMN